MKKKISVDNVEVKEWNFGDEPTLAEYESVYIDERDGLVTLEFGMPDGKGEFLVNSASPIRVPLLERINMFLHPESPACEGYYDAIEIPPIRITYFNQGTKFGAVWRVPHFFIRSFKEEKTFKRSLSVYGYYILKTVMEVRTDKINFHAVVDAIKSFVKVPIPNESLTYFFEKNRSYFYLP